MALSLPVYARAPPYHAVRQEEAREMTGIGYNRRFLEGGGSRMTWWTADHITAFATTGLALATTWMAWKTAKLTKQEERHHQDGSMPICFLDEVTWDRGSIVKLQEDNNGGQPVFEYRIYAPLRNIGQGPALNLRLTLRFMTYGNHEVSVDLDPLGAGKVRGIYSEPIPPPHLPKMVASVASVYASDAARRIATIPVSPVPGFNDTAIKGSQDAWTEIFLEYTDIFGNHFYTQHTKSPQQQWMQFGKGSRPVPIAAPPIPSNNRPTPHA